MRGNKDYTLVNVDIKKLDDEWSRDTPGYYLSEGGGENQIAGRYERFKKWLQDNPGIPIEAPLISWREDNDSVSFTDGRHRYAVLRDMGYDRIGIMVPKEQVKVFRSSKFAAYSNASTQVNLPDNVAAKVMELSKGLIPDEDLAGKGREIQPHITLKYGVEEDAEGLRRACAGMRPFPVTFGKLHVFDPSGSSEGTSPIVVEAIGSGLAALKAKIDEEIGNRADDFPTYQPHVTVAYVKPEIAAKYEGAEGIKGVSFMVREVVLSRKSDAQERVQLEQAVGVTAGFLDGPQDITIQEDFGTAEGYVADTVAEQLPNWLDRYNYTDQEFIAMIRANYDQFAVLNNVNVDESERGHGFGNSLLEDYIAEAEAKGAGVILLCADTAEEQAQGFDLVRWYEGYGFQDVAEVVGGHLMMLPLRAKSKTSAEQGSAENIPRAIYVLINQFKYGYRNQRLGWQYALNLSPNALEYLSKLDFTSGEYRLVQTADLDFAEGRVKIGEFNGWNLPSSEEKTQKLQALWDTASEVKIAAVKQAENDYNSVREGRKHTYAPFMALADAQRGAPEHAMLRIQHDPMGPGVYSYAVEHVGDLTHRMNEETAIMFGTFGYDTVKYKVENVLGKLENSYGFIREMEGNLKNNYEAQKAEKFKNKDFGKAVKDFGQKCKRYAEAHAALKVYNRPQELARDAAVALGNWLFEDAANKLNALMGLINAGKEAWIAAASQGVPKTASKTAAGDAWEQLKQDWRAGIVYHGTTVDIARIIEQEGFRGLEFKEIRDEVLDKYNKTFEQLPKSRQKMLDGLDRSYTSEHHLVSTAPGGEVATRWAGSGGEVARQIEQYALGDRAKGSRIGGEPAVVVARIKNFAGSRNAERAERCITGWEKLMVDGSQVKAEGYTTADAAKDLWQSYINFLCKPEELEYLGTLVRGDIDKLKQGPFMMSFGKDASHKTPPMSDTRYAPSGEYGQGQETNAYADIPEFVQGVEAMPSLEELSPDLFKVGSGFPVPDFEEVLGMEDGLSSVIPNWEVIRQEAAQKYPEFAKMKEGDPEYERILDEVALPHAQAMWESAADRLRALKFPLTIYRALGEVSLKEINTGRFAEKGFGKYWTWDEANCAYINKELSAAHIVIVRGVIPNPSVINIAMTSWKNFVAEDEREIELIPGTVVQVTGYKYKGDTKWSKPPKALKTVTAYADETDGMPEHGFKGVGGQAFPHLRRTPMFGEEELGKEKESDGGKPSLKSAGSRLPKFYHGTSRERLDNILKNGLQPGHDESSIEWGKAVYLACDANTAANYEGHKGEGRGDWVILEIDGKKLHEDLLRPDDYDFRDMWERESMHADVNSELAPMKEEYGDDWTAVPWDVSLKVCCQVAYMGNIPPDAIRVIDNPQPRYAAGNSNLTNWFGASKVVNADFTPRIVYHGSKATWIDSFDMGREGTGVHGGKKWGAIWFTSSYENAEEYADPPSDAKPEASTDEVNVYGNDPYYAAVEDINGEEMLFSVGPYDTEEEAEEAGLEQARLYNDKLEENTNVQGVYLKIVRPYITDQVPREPEFQAAKAGGHDGIIAYDVVDGYTRSDIFVVFNPSQVKSATMNKGTYSPQSQSILSTKKAKQENVPGQVYLLHFDIDPGDVVPATRADATTKTFHARHYLGWALNAQDRIDEHYKGQSGVKLIDAIHAANITFTVSRVWDNVTREFERRLKNQGGLGRHCPICKALGLDRDSLYKKKLKTVEKDSEVAPATPEDGPDFVEQEKLAAGGTRGKIAGSGWLTWNGVYHRINLKTAHARAALRLGLATREDGDSENDIIEMAIRGGNVRVMGNQFQAWEDNADTRNLIADAIERSEWAVFDIEFSLGRIFENRIPREAALSWMWSGDRPGTRGTSIMGSVDGFVYHGTSGNNLSAIAAEGLVPQPPDQDGWPEFDEDPVFEEEDEETPAEAFEPRVFAFEDFEPAVEYAKNYPNGVVLRFPSEFAMNRGATDYSYVYGEETVPPQQIQVWKDGQWNAIAAASEG